MTLVKLPRVQFATDESMATITKKTGSAFRAALEDLLAAVAAGVIADHPAIIAALEAQSAELVGEALSEAGIVRYVDPGIPKENRWPADPVYAARETDRLGRMTRGVLAKDGTQHLPLARVDQLRIGSAGPLITWGVPGSGVAFTFKDINGRMSDLSIGLDGHFLPHTIEYLGKQLGTGGSPNGGRAILVFCGQSNSQTGPSYLTIPGIREEDSRIDIWTGTEIVPLPADDVSMGAEVAREYARNHPGQRVLVVFCGVGSIGFTTTSIQPPPAGYRYFAAGTWDRSLTADPQNRYVKAVALTLGALAAAGPGSWIEAAFWSQGEADGGLTQAQYLAKAVDVFSNFRIDVGVPDLPWVIGSMTPEMHVDHEGFEQIARALADVPRALERTGFVWGPANGHRYNQTVHYSYAGQIDRAGRMAREGLIEARANVLTNEPVSPLNSRVRRNGGTATVEWDRPLCHVDALAVEYSTNYNPADPTVATWAPALIDTMHGSRATAAVPSATAVAFRTTVTNAVGSTMPALVNA
ncbi:sialate O-acetylesterase [Microbacterium sp. Root280D1]|uniref:sialate O-acetylesterase n=1 Tax=Microbacterium sp. Root280D1 TaxID=1736510 RepID=UPI0006F539F0|nr:sialate O-acetylesterase [Microbacterium sp. Root280D1]KRD51972.1 hypothetical protein ASE34_08630 [Microbacterium sp. Root280D1]